MNGDPLILLYLFFAAVFFVYLEAAPAFLLARHHFRHWMALRKARRRELYIRATAEGWARKRYAGTVRQHWPGYDWTADAWIDSPRPAAGM